jgi:hypothetical protein
MRVTLAGHARGSARHAAVRYGPVPETVAETRITATTRANVTRLSVTGDSHEKRLAASQARNPLAPPATVAAVAMH